MNKDIKQITIQLKNKWLKRIKPLQRLVKYLVKKEGFGKNIKVEFFKYNADNILKDEFTIRITEQ